MKDIFDDPDRMNKITKELREKQQEDFFQRRYSGACYDILVNSQARAVVAVDKSNKVISNVMIAIWQDREYKEVIFSKEELIKEMMHHSYFSPNININMNPTKIRIINSNYLSIDPNNTPVDNLGNLPSIDQWKKSDARKYLKQTFAALKQGLN